MATVIWAEPALQDLDAIADYIALDKPDAARRLVQEVFAKVGRLQKFPKWAQCRLKSLTYHTVNSLFRPAVSFTAATRTRSMLFT